MAEYIDKQVAIDVLATMQGLCTNKTALVQNSKIWQQIKDLPSVDAVEVVRCKDCKYCDTGIDEDGNHFLKCLGWAYGGTKEDDYCSHGVRKDG